MTKRKEQLVHGDGRKMSPALIRALDHPLRRQALRILHEEEIELSPVEVTKRTQAELSRMSYHVRELAELRVIRQTRTDQVRGSTAHFYISLVADNELVGVILAHTAEDDE